MARFKLNFNVIAVISSDGQSCLMCLRKRNPYKGLYNLVGGKIEEGESGEAAAYRELFEETGITKEQITLAHIVDFDYYLSDIHMEFWGGQLKETVDPAGEENPLCWMPLTENFFDTSRFAGMGNIGHMLLEMRYHGLIRETGGEACTSPN